MSISSGYTFGELLKQFRVREGMSQKDLADALHVHRNTISNWECGNDLPKTRPVVLTLSENLHLNQDDTNELFRTSLLEISSKEPLESHHVLSKYLHQRRTQLLDAPVPGSINLRMREIVECEGLFIPPPWRIANTASSQKIALLDYLLGYISKNQRILLLGEAGQGKTTVLKHIFSILVDGYMGNPRGIIPLPFYIPLRELSTFHSNVIDLLWSYVGQQFPLPFPDFAFLVQNSQIVVLLDGFDEINGELTQRSINERAASRLFTLPSVLSCRKDFYEFYLSMSSIQELYPQKVELQPLTLNHAVTRYITAYYTKKSEVAAKELTTTPEKIIQTLQDNQALRDLAQRPLLLMMMLDTFVSAQTVEEFNSSWNTAKLYQKYTEKWLKNEASKPDSVLKWYEKAAIIQELAWWLYTARGATSSSSQIYEGVTFTQNELTTILESLSIRMQHAPLHQLIDDVCLRTFLIGSDGGTYYFIHKSFQEYYAAKHIFEHLKQREQNIEAVACVLREHFSLEVAVFLKHMLRAKEFSRSDRTLVVKNLIDAYQRNCRDDPKSVTIRNNASYYAAFLGGQDAVQFLQQAYKQESNKWVQRSMMVGLALFCDRADILEQYIDMLLADAEAASINIGYHLVYYGDQSLEEGYYDRGGQKCDGAVRSIFDRLRNGNYRKAWVLDLFTLRTLLEQRGVSVLGKNEQDISFLKEFLGKKHEGQGSIFHQEKKRLQELLGKE